MGANPSLSTIAGLDRAKMEPQDSVATLAAVEAFLRERRKRLAFPTWLESRFVEDTRNKLARGLFASTLKTIAIYNVFLVGDWLLAPDALLLATTLHLCVVTPMMAAAALVFRARPTRTVRELTAAAIPVAMVAQIVSVYAFSRAENAPHYLYFVLMATILTTTAFRLSYRAACGVTLANFILLTATLIFTNRLPVSVALMQEISFAVCAYASLRGDFDREREFRRAYLHRLRDSLRVASTDAEARHDALTGLTNRRGLDEAGARLWSGANPDAFPVALVLIDVDRFKSYNDLYGHQAGDACLKRIAACIAREPRESEALAARYGGEEFMLILPRTQLADAVVISERLRRAIAAQEIAHSDAEGPGYVTASFGVAAARTASGSFETLTASADAALYQAKHAGRNRVAAAGADLCEFGVELT